MKDFTQALPNSKVAPTPSPYSYSPRTVTHTRIFFRLYTPILTILTKDFTQALQTFNFIPNLHAVHTLKCRSMACHILLLRPTNLNPHPYANTIFRSPSSRYLPYEFFRLSTAIYNIFTKDFTQALPTSTVTTTPTPYSDSPPRATNPTIFPASLPPF